MHKTRPLLRTYAYVHDYNIRGRDLLIVPLSRTCTFAKNKVDVKLFNALPNELKVLTYSAFKCKLKAFLIEKAVYSV